MLGNNVRRLRNQKGWSQVYLADKLEVSVSFISIIESGQRGVSLPLIENIAEVFNVSVPFLFTDHDKNDAENSMDILKLSDLESDLKDNMNAFLTDFFNARR